MKAKKRQREAMPAGLTDEAAAREYDVAALAERLGLPEDIVAGWRTAHGRAVRSGKRGRPKGKIQRPMGTLSLGEIADKFKISPAKLARWRAEGLPTRKIGTMIVVKETDVERWRARK